MGSQLTTDVDVPQTLLDAIASFPLKREVMHCGQSFETSPFDIYTNCPVCKTRFKVRAFGAISEIEDVFDAVFVWMNQPGAAEIVLKRQQEIAADAE